MTDPSGRCMREGRDHSPPPPCGGVVCRSQTSWVGRRNRRVADPGSAAFLESFRHADAMTNAMLVLIGGNFASSGNGGTRWRSVNSGRLKKATSKYPTELRLKVLGELLAAGELDLVVRAE